MDEWISRQHTSLVVAQENQLKSDQHQLVENDLAITDYLSTLMYCSHLRQDVVTSFFPSSAYSVRTTCHFARFTPDSDFFSPHILYSTHSTSCLSTDPSVVNITLTTIAHHIFSSVLAVPQYIYISVLPIAVTSTSCILLWIH